MLVLILVAMMMIHLTMIRLINLLFLTATLVQKVAKFLIMVSIRIGGTISIQFESKTLNGSIK